MTVRVRFAPAPTGDLHEGGALVAVANHLLRLRDGGALVLRIDDTDAERLDPAAAGRIAADLAWLGIVPDEGPHRQSERLDRHRVAAERLVAAGAAAQGPDGAVALAAPTADVVVDDLSRGPIRIPADELGPTVLVRADGRPTYHLATAVDDQELGITHVLRGEDHLVNSARQLALCAALGVEPPAFAHLPIVVGDDGARLSSRSGALGIGRLRDAGHLPEAVVDWLARSACPPIAAASAPSPIQAATLAEAEAAVRAILDAPPLAAAGEADRAAAAALVAALPGAPDPLDATAAGDLIAALGCGKRPLRRVLTAADSGIPLPFVLAALPRATALARAQAVLDQP